MAFEPVEPRRVEEEANSEPGNRQEDRNEALIDQLINEESS